MPWRLLSLRLTWCILRYCREVIGAVLDELLSPKHRQGVVVDGFPRTQMQVCARNEARAECGYNGYTTTVTDLLLSLICCCITLWTTHCPGTCRTYCASGFPCGSVHVRACPLVPGCEIVCICVPSPQRITVSPCLPFLRRSLSSAAPCAGSVYQGSYLLLLCK